MDPANELPLLQRPSFYPMILDEFLEVRILGEAFWRLNFRKPAATVTD
jgi:hypothetical protein